jgi:hypothetical protein
MKIAKENIEVKMEIPGAVIRQRTDFGDATRYGKISGELSLIVKSVSGSLMKYQFYDLS